MKAVPVLAIVAVLGLASNVRAAVIDYVDFSSVAGLDLNGAAAQAGNRLRVTPAIDSQAGSVFSLSPVSLAADASFSTFFQFQFTSPGAGGADGLVFVVQTNSSDVGTGGGGIGYLGIDNSVGVEFDNWFNSGFDSDSNHVGIDVGGDINSAARREVTEAQFDSGDIWSAWIDYNGASNLLEVRLNRTGVRPTIAFLSLTQNLALELGSTNAFVGFTSGTGAAHANHDVLNWQLENTFAPIGVPEPTTLTLLGLGTAGMAVIRRRRQARRS